MRYELIDTKGFYQTPKWRKVAQRIRQKYNYTCQICGKRGNLIHHIKPLTQKDYDLKPAEKCYGESNLTCLCHNCHEEEHSRGKVRRGLYFDENGELQIKD